MEKLLTLSSSKLGILRDCPKCFWLLCAAKLERPRGIYPSLPNGMDLVLKRYADQYRGGLPPELAGKVEGMLFPNLEHIRKLRHWRSGLQAEIVTPDGLVQLIGALDDLLMGDDLYSPLDFKTKGSAPKTSGEEYYGTQVDVYSLLLEANGMKPSGFAYLSYWYPQAVCSEPGRIAFGVDVVRLEASADRARSLIAKATALLAGPIPPVTPGCDYCTYIQNYARVPLLAS